MHWDKRAVAIALDEVTRCRPIVLCYLKELLDSYHGESRELAYYDLLASDWLEPFTHLVYVAMQEVGGANNTAEDLSVPVSTDLAVAKSHFLEPCFHEQLRMAVAYLSCGGSIRNWKFENDDVVIVSGRRESFSIRLVRSFSTSQPHLLVTAPYFKCSKFEWVSSLWRWRRWLAWDDFQYPIRIASRLDSSWRKAKAISTLPATNLNELVRVLLPLHLPVALLEGFAEYRKAVLAFPVLRPRMVYSANSLHSHLAWKLLVAEWRQQGTLLLYHQHGGGYGIDRSHSIEAFESRVADRYYTFGWHSDKHHIKPLTPPRINAPNRLRTRLLLSCLDMPRVVYRLHFQPMPGTIETMHSETCAFLISLSDRSKLLIRPYSQDYGWGAVEMMRKAAPDAEIDDRQNLSSDRFAESRLVIHNYLGSGWLETLALDIPTVCFYDADTYLFREEAQPYIDALENVGVLHHSGSSAAQFVAALGDNIETWWRKRDVQQARLAFVRQYANFSSDWKREWEQEFKAVLHDAQE